MDQRTTEGVYKGTNCYFDVLYLSKIRTELQILTKSVYLREALELPQL